ncbi:MAG: ABC transporter ATP-binding protein [Planctomycetes bacterium]|nr:ABC transporter ATP-binding protein [Planctomycetota bacterium]
METWSRLIQAVVPYWRRLLMSLVFGALSALLWSAELGLTFPITITFGEHRTIHNYVRHQIETSTRIINDRKEALEKKTRELDLILEDGSEGHRKNRVNKLNEIRRDQQRLESESTRLWLASWIESRILPNIPSEPFPVLAVLFGLAVVAAIGKGLCSFLQDLLAGEVAESVTIDLREQLFQKTLRLDPQTVALGGTQKLMNDMTTTLQMLSHGLGDLGGRIVREPLKAITCISLMFAVNWQLTLFFLAVVPVIGWMFHVLGQRLKRTTKSLLDRTSQIYKCLEETFVNIKAVIAYGTAGYHRRRLHQRGQENYQSAMRLVRLKALTDVVVELFAVSSVLGVLLPASYLVLRNETSIAGIKLADSPPSFPELATFYALLVGVIDPLRKFSRFYTTIRQTNVIADQLFKQMDRESLVSNPKAPKWITYPFEKLEFRDVHFSYASPLNEVTPERGPALKGLDLSIGAGEFVAIVGPNGSGKSTLTGLIPRFYDPNQGSVLINGLDLKQIRLREMRQQIAIVSQETLLFDDSIRSNIRYGRPGATLEDIEAAAHRARVLDFANDLPQKLDTPVGEGGRQLSGGQRQRVALARAMLRDPQILILDEPTSAIDAESEALIHAALKDFVQGRTTLIVTHSLPPALKQLITRIVVLDRGHVVGSGTPEELQATCPIYRQLFETAMPIAA